MTYNLKHRLIYLIQIFNAAAKLTCYPPFQIDAVNIMDKAYEDLQPYHKYWRMVNLKVGIIKLKKDEL